MKRLKLFAMLVLFPILLAGVGVWEHQRATEEIADLAEFETTVQSALPELRAIADRSKMTIVNLGGEKVAVMIAIDRLEKAQNQLGTTQAIAAVRPGLASAVMGFGVLTALIGLGALLATQAAGKTARKSRDHLLRVFSRGRRVLPFVLVSHISLTALAVAAAVIYEALALWHLGKMSSGDFKGMAFAGLLGLACLWTVWQMLRQLKAMRSMFEPTPMDVLGRVVSEAEAPGLWTHVRALAAKLGALPPDHIVVGMVDGFYVTAADVLVEPANVTLRGRTLHVPLVHLALLDRAESGAVIGHELGHFAGADTDYTMRFLPIYDGVARSLTAVHVSILEADWLQRTLMKPAFLFGLFFMESFDHAVNHWSREREIAADAAGAKAAGQAAAGSALVRVASSAEAVHASMSTHLTDPKSAPDDMLLAVVNDVAAQPLSMPSELLEESLPHPSDSHPPTLTRINALALPLDSVVQTGIRPVDPAVVLATLDGYFADAPALRRGLSADLRARLVADDAEIVEVLQSHAKAVDGECRLHEGARVRGVVLALLGLCFLGIAVVLATGHLWLNMKANEKQLMLFMLGGAVVGAIGLWLLIRGWLYVKYAKEAALVMTPDTLWFSNSTAPLPISHLADVSLTVHGNFYLIRFELDPDAPLPVFKKRKTGMPGARLFKKKRMIQLVMAKACIEGKSLSAQVLLETLAAYFNAGQARQALQEWKQPVSLPDAAQPQ
ncbi:M48 family metalloprotease [Pigmentiphaga aceris]|uniref:M48 family metalloprotease n=1 Tax=Pigmentiphaga aceris TaxID=1940612 RepID=A0A5C0AY47_9BURK|nr:M48 family metallopeptidase [Pigmentiphaga aceris]QEI06494.1 M48 family metalloprotease [Pigmentiphaga aceris]